MITFSSFQCFINPVLFYRVLSIVLIRMGILNKPVAEWLCDPEYKTMNATYPAKHQLSRSGYIWRMSVLPNKSGLKLDPGSRYLTKLYFNHGRRHRLMLKLTRKHRKHNKTNISKIPLQPRYYDNQRLTIFII